MSAASPDIDLTEPHLGEMLATAGLDVEYVRADGNTLFRRADDGTEVPVVDFAGGYGSLIFGHHHPEIVGALRAALDAGTPVYAQFSRHPIANRVAARLNDILRRDAGATEPYYTTFASTGAEAIEAAVKHAEFDRSIRAATLLGEIEARVEAAGAAVRSGDAVVAESAYAALGVAPGTDGTGFDALVAEVSRHNARTAARPPVFLALEGSFHGKLVGSVQFTHNAGFRTAFSALAAQAVFVPFDRPEALAKTVEEERARIWDVVVRDGRVEVEQRDFPVFCAFLIEPIQGEGGIRAVTAETAAEIQRVTAEVDCPIVIDEIQTGLGRTGAFLASAAIGLRGDYYVFSKSLGGGLTKSSVMLVRQARYRKEFELVHSSTFAKDGLSSTVALKVLELLEADDGLAYRRATERGERIAAMLRGVRADFPEVVADVRGRGLMLGFEFRDQSGSPSGPIATLARDGVLGYLLSGWLLRRHRIRALPTASAVHTLRFAPSIEVSDEEIDQLEAGLREICAILRDRDEAGLFS
ncbi:aminotransferase class III-fold pyridoxal phosphate-dependent enzyme [Streptomyces sp. NPDC020875]|uniref:aspartate aminotransferase family protein n=1 Tax=Streptomyces sp. NPDC020875 TaxID=3154898 RepID=UPI0033FAA6E9